MEGASSQVKVALLLFALSLCGCKPAVPEAAREGGIPFRAFESGDLICRLGNGYFSGIFRNISTRDKRYSHVGIIYKPGQQSAGVWVIHAEADELTGRGAVLLQPLDSFLLGVRRWSVFRTAGDSRQRTRIAALALDCHRSGTPFDTRFDLTDTTALYCTELVAKCVNLALSKTLVRPRAHFAGRPVYAVDDAFSGAGTREIFSNPITTCKKEPTWKTSKNHL